VKGVSSPPSKTSVLTDLCQRHVLHESSLCSQGILGSETGTTTDNAGLETVNSGRVCSVPEPVSNVEQQASVSGSERARFQEPGAPARHEPASIGAYGLIVAIFQWGWVRKVVGIGRLGPIEFWVSMRRLTVCSAS
jgi:hypothetical protein